MEIFIHRINLQ